MDILLDTHIVYWSLTDTGRLPPGYAQQLENNRNRLWLSSICLAEMAIKASIGKLDIPDGFHLALDRLGLMPLPFRAEHAAILGTLELHHRDPFDRMIVAQAIGEELVIATKDAQFGRYPVKLLPY